MASPIENFIFGAFYCNGFWILSSLFHFIFGNVILLIEAFYAMLAMVSVDYIIIRYQGKKNLNLYDFFHKV